MATEAFKYERQGTRCACARHNDGSVTTFLCPVHADSDPCLTRVAGHGPAPQGHDPARGHSEVTP